MRLLLLIFLATIVFGIVGFALIWFGEGRDLQGPSVAFLTRMRDSALEDAHGAMHPDFQARVSEAQLDELWRYWGTKYGDFGEVVRRVGVSRWHDSVESAELLKLDLGFRHGHVIGWFFYGEHEGTPKLHHVSLKPRARVDVAATERARLQVTAKRLFGYLDAGEGLAFYDALHPMAQMRVDPDAIVMREAKVREALGALESVTLLDNVGSTDLTEKQRFELTYERGTRVMSVMHRHEQGQWWVVEVVPE